MPPVTPRDGGEVMTSLTDLQGALDSFREAWGGGYLACDIGTKLTCSEVEALARLFTELGDEASAQCWIREHSFGDDCGDLHCRCAQCHPHAHSFTLNPHYCDECGGDARELNASR